MASFAADLQNITLTAVSVSPATAISSATTTNGSSVDVSKCVGPISALVNCVAITGSGTQAVVTLQYSANGGSSWTNVAVDDNIDSGTVTFTTTGGASVGFITTSEPLGKLVRAVVVTTGAAVSVTLDIVIVGLLQKVGSGSGQQTSFIPGSGF